MTLVLPRRQSDLVANWVVQPEPGAVDAWIANTDPSLSAQAEVLVCLAELVSAL